MEQKKSDEGKEITAMLCAVRKNLEDLPFLAKGESEEMSDKAFYAADMTDISKKIDSIDTIVNSASPDLMGSKKIDNLLHNLIDQKLKENNVEFTFNQYTLYRCRLHSFAVGDRWAVSHYQIKLSIGFL